MAPTAFVGAGVRQCRLDPGRLKLVVIDSNSNSNKNSSNSILLEELTADAPCDTETPPARAETVNERDRYHPDAQKPCFSKP